VAEEMAGWIDPPDQTVAAEYWVTRRSADAAPGYDHGLPDIRVRYRWVTPGLMGTGSWITGYFQGIQRREAMLACLHSANGWRIEGVVEEQSP
jgi:hypothetical protein